MDKNSNPFLNSDWLDMQRQYLEILSSLIPDAGTADFSNPQQSAWLRALEDWKESTENVLPDQDKLIYSTIFQQTKIFYSLAGWFTALLQEITAKGNDTDAWQEIMERHFDLLKTQFNSTGIGDTDSGDDPSSVWWSLFDTWKQTWGSLVPVTAGRDHNRSENPFVNIFENPASNSGVGPGRALQEKILKGNRLWDIYRKNLQKYQTACAELGVIAVDRLKQRIIAKAGSGEKISSLKQLYTLWVDANEEVYAEFAFTEDYSQLYGNLVNSLMELKQHANSVGDDMLAILNVPTSRGMKTTRKRQQLMRHQLRVEMQSRQQTENSMNELRAELDKLRKQLNAGKSKPKRNRSKKQVD